MRPWLQKWRNNRRPPEILCYFNDWWYFFRANEYSGEYSYLGDTQALIYADALLDTKDATILYSGILVDFVIKEDSLEFIYLNGLSKKMFNKKNPDGTTSIEEGEGISIQPSSGLMCIPYSKIINLYIRFVAPIETYFINQLEERIDTEPGYLDDINVKFEDVTPPNE
jgi:hypothetical protein